MQQPIARGCRTSATHVVRVDQELRQEDRVAIDEFRAEPPQGDHTQSAKRVGLQDQVQREDKHLASSALETEPPQGDDVKREVNSLPSKG